MFDQYKIGIHLVVTDQATTQIGFLTRHLRLSEAAAAKLQTRLTAIKGLFVGGGMLLGAGTAIGAPLLYAIDKAAELQKQLIAVQIATRGTTADMNSMRSAIEGIAAQTVFSNIDIAKQAKLIATGTGMNAADVQGVLPAYAKYADVQMLLKGSAPEQSINDAIRAAHGAGHYDPASLTTYLDLLTKASLIQPGSNTEVVRALAYFQNVSKNVLGMNDENAVLSVALANRLGFPGTRGGNNLTAALTRSIPGIFGSGLLTGKSNAALTDMGMVDAKGHAKVFDENGKFSLIKWMGLTADFVNRQFASNPEGVARQNIMKDFQHAYGTIGSRLTSALGSDKSIEQFKQIGAQFNEYGGFEAMQKQFADDSVAQKWMNAKTNLTSAMTELGYTLLPKATEALKDFNTTMGKAIAWMTANPGKVGEYATNLGKLSLALAGLGVVSIVTSGVTGLVTALGLLRAAIAATTGAAAASAAINPMAGVGGLPAVGKAAKLGNIVKGLAVAGAAYEITDFIANDIFGLDSIIAGWFSKDYDPNAKPNAKRSFAPPSGAGGGQPTQVNLNLDGHKIGSILFNMGGKDATGPQTGISGFDPTRSIHQAGGL